MASAARNQNASTTTNSAFACRPLPGLGYLLRGRQDIASRTEGSGHVNLCHDCVTVTLGACKDFKSFH